MSFFVFVQKRSFDVFIYMLYETWPSIWLPLDQMKKKETKLNFQLVFTLDVNLIYIYCFLFDFRIIFIVGRCARLRSILFNVVSFIFLLFFIGIHLFVRQLNNSSPLLCFSSHSTKSRSMCTYRMWTYQWPRSERQKFSSFLVRLGKKRKQSEHFQKTLIDFKSNFALFLNKATGTKKNFVFPAQTSNKRIKYRLVFYGYESLELSNLFEFHTTHTCLTYEFFLPTMCICFVLSILIFVLKHSPSLSFTLQNSKSKHLQQD